MLVFLQGPKVDIFVEHIPGGRDVEVAQMSKRLFPVIKLEKLPFFEFVEVDPEVKWIFFMRNRVVLTEIFFYLVCLPQKLNRKNHALLKTNAFAFV
jgi:hypothetical protein